MCPVMTYDLTGDGYVNARDLVTLQQYAAAIDRGEGAYERLLDFNGDGRITAADMDGAARFYRCRQAGRKHLRLTEKTNLWNHGLVFVFFY